MRLNPLSDFGKSEYMAQWIIPEKAPWYRGSIAFWLSNKKSTEEEEGESKGGRSGSSEGARLIGKEYKSKPWTFTHTVYINMGGLRVVVPHPEQQNKVSVLNVEGHHIANFSFDSAYSPLRHFSMSRDEILDKSKEDWLTRLITVLQILWLLISVSARKVRGLSTSQLEILALAYASIAVATYLVLWNKPKGIDIPTTIHLERFSENSNSNRDMHWKLSCGKKGCGTKDCGTKGCRTKGCGTKYCETLRNDHRRNVMWSCASFTVPATMFGDLHCLAWNSNFPSTTESIMWKSASITIAALPLVFSIPWILVFLKDKDRSPWIHTLHKTAAAIAMAVYCLARLCIIGISLSSLRSMPANVYLTVWPDYIPGFH